MVSLVRGGPDSATAEALRLEGKSLEQSGRKDEALAKYRAAIVRDRGHIASHRDYQNLMRAMGKGDEVRAEYRKHAEAAPQSAAAQYLAARLEEGDALVAGMKRALQLDADFIWAHRALAAHCWFEKRPEDAARHFEAAARSPDATSEDGGALVAFLYRQNSLEDLDRIIMGWNSSRPGFGRVDFDGFMLGPGPNATGLQLHVAFSPEALEQFLYALRVTRSDKAFRQLSVRRGDGKYVLSWTTEWTHAAQHESATPPETWVSADRPSFTEVHAALLARLRDK